jgi:hypothetical protein
MPLDSYFTATSSMKKTLFTLLLVGASAGVASAQVEIGLKVSPSITSLRTESRSEQNFQNDKSKVSIGGGLIVDYFFGQNYAFSTGFLLTGKGGTISYRDIASPTSPDLVTRTQKIGLQYLEVPVTVKLYTNDVATDTKLYFQVGGSANVAIASKINGNKFYDDPATAEGETKALKHFIFPDAALLLGVGAEYQVGQSTKLLAGISYHRGLVNVDRYFDNTRGFDGVTIKNNEVALDLGIKF